MEADCNELNDDLLDEIQDRSYEAGYYDLIDCYLPRSSSRVSIFVVVYS